MYKPRLAELQRSREIIGDFTGYNKNPVIPENSFYDEKNMSLSEYPLLSPRNKRAFFNVTGDGLHGLFSKSKLIYINNGSLYYGGERVEGLHFAESEKKRRFVSMGALLLVFPDKVYINTADLSDYGSLEAFFESGEGVGVTAAFCKADGELYDGYTVGGATPEQPQNGDLWVDTSVTPNVLRQYSQGLGDWFDIAATYVKISTAGIGKSFNTDDGVTVEGLSDSLDGSHIITHCGDDFIIVAGIIPNTITSQNNVKISRRLPDMDFVAENGNRLWGCSSEKNEIYASKLGDAKNFFCYRGISTDSYAVTVGSDGDFTGAVSYRGYVLFFKENCVHKIYGQNPPFSVSASYIRGVQKGSEGSLVILNESLFYKSPNGVCVFDGGVPVDISKALGGEYFTDAVAGALGDVYYICMSDKDGGRVLFTFDESKSLWSKQDDIDIREFATHNYNLYFIADTPDGRRLCLADGENRFGNFSGELAGYCEENDFQWMAQTGLWGLSVPENKYYSSVIFRLWGEKGASFRVEVQTNSDGEWVEQLSEKIEKTGSLVLPFTLPRCDHLALRLSGKGKVKIYSIARALQKGSELDV